MALQHRGHDAAGVAGLGVVEPRCIEIVKDLGKVANVITPKNIRKFTGNTFVGHTRYATRNKDTSKREIHPHWAQSLNGRLAIVTNGDMLNVTEQKEFLDRFKIRTYTTNDAEILAAVVNYHIRFKNRDVMTAVKKAMLNIKGGYAGLILLEEDDRLVGFRDPWGIRPLHIAEFEIQGQKGVAFASETCAFDILQRYCSIRYQDDQLTFDGQPSGEQMVFKYREVLPGEIIAVNPDCSIESVQYHSTPSKSIGCVFESIYFSRPDSLQRGESFQVLRERIGKQLFEESPVEADIVTAVPKGGIPSAVGFARASGIPYSVVILEEPITGGIRSFTTNEKDRKSIAAMKYNILADVVQGKKLVVVDDSIVRGTTMRLLVKALFQAGAAEVHLRIPCPPYSHACHYGIATKDPQSLISNNKTNGEICEELGATSLSYISLSGLYTALEKPRNYFCDECLSGDSPI